MKNFSTAALLLVLASAFAPTAQAQTSTNASVARCAFRADAPDRHVVVRGDTLWDISGRFLEKPWCWPQVWNLNRDQIRNPHWIYPGQIVYFDRAQGRLRIGDGNGNDADGATPTVRLSPRIRSEDANQQAIASISLREIGQFLTEPLIVDADELAGTPRIVATREQRVVVGNDDTAYVRGDLGENREFRVFRSGKPLKDPSTGKVIGYEAAFLGTMLLKRASTEDNQPHTFVVTSVKQEMGVGDRLLPIEPTPFINYVPHPPAQPVQGQIVSIYNGVSQAGQNQIVTINRGRNDGIDIGTVLELQRLGRTLPDRTTENKESIKLPDERYGNLFIFRVFNNIAYGLVLQVRDTVQIGDVVRAPD